MKKSMTTLFFVIATTYLAFGLLLVILQRNFLYFPTNSIDHNHETRETIHNGAALIITILNKGRPKALLYFGGNAENVDYNAPHFSGLLIDHTIYLVHYRGYGGSTGLPTEKTLYADALHIFDLLQKEHSVMSVIGRSLGSGVATYIASKRKPSKLILVTPFDSIRAVAQKQFPFYPITWLLKDQYDSASRVNQITAKTLVIMAQNDTIIGSNHTGKLVEKFPAQQVTVKTITNTGHNSVSNTKQYWHFIQHFLEK